MIGAIVGDIVGSIYEHHPIRTTDFPLWGLGCRFTDDTVLTVAVADALLHGRSYVDVFREYYIRYPEAGYGGSFHKWARSLHPQPYGSWGNGSAMRVSSIGWFLDSTEAAVAEARRSAEVTHNHPEGIRGAECVAACIVEARHGQTREDLRGLVEDRFYRLPSTLAELRPSYTFDVSCAGTVPVAVLAVLESTDFESAIRLAVSMDGDSDTLACIAGSIAQAFYGGVPAMISQRARQFLTPDLEQIVDEFEGRFHLQNDRPNMNPNYATAHFRAAPPPSGWPPSFAIVTACNPYHPDGQTVSAEENTNLDALLESHLREQGYRHWRVIGGSPDFLHAEPSFTVEVPLPQAIELGRKFRQEAIFWIEGDDLHLVACQGSEQQPLGSWRARLSHSNAVS